MGIHVREQGEIRASAFAGVSTLALAAVLWLATHCLSWGQAIPAPAPPQAAAPGSARSQAERGLTTRYQMLERYALGPVASGLGTYQVAFRETISLHEEQAAAAPQTSEFTRTAVYSERVVRTGSVDPRQVDAVLRQYDSASVVPDPWEGMAGPKLMQDLEVYIARPASASTRAISLTGGRLLRDQEYRFSMGNAFVPAIAQCVPESGMRIGDSWVIPRSAAIVLLGEGIGDGLLTGRLSEVAPVTGQVSGWEEAQIDVEGRVTTGRGPTAVRARLTFRFLPESGAVGSAPAPLPAAENKDESAPAAPADAVKQQDVVPGDVVRGLGGLSKIRLSQVSSTPSLGEGLPAVERRRQLVLERRWPGTGPELPILEEPPAETAANSWLEYTDPQGRFHFMHPQDLRTKDASELLPTVQAQLASGDVIMLGRPRPEGEDVLTLFYLGGQQPKHEDLFQAGFEKYRAAGFQVDVGEATKLAAEDWEGVEATRIEAMLTAPANQSVPGAQSRTQFDGYLLRFTQNASLMATSSTRQTEVGNFRNEVEQVLQTFRLGPPQSAASP